MSENFNKIQQIDVSKNGFLNPKDRHKPVYLVVVEDLLAAKKIGYWISKRLNHKTNTLELTGLEITATEYKKLVTQDLSILLEKTESGMEMIEFPWARIIKINKVVDKE